MSYFENRYKKICPDFTLCEKEKASLRVNTLKIEDSALLARLKKKKVTLEKIPFLAHGYWFEASFSLGATPEYLQGLYYLQGASSQMVSETLAPQKNETILDMAAAPGGKTTHLAQIMNNTGVIIALDTNPQRLAALRNNCERLLVTNVLILKKDARYARDLGMQFDKILLDAPCSGNFCSEEGWFAKRRIEDIRENARTQRELIKAAYSVLKPGGILVYSTCSLEPEEDEVLVDWALSKYSDLTLQALDFAIGDKGITVWEDKKLDESLAKTKRFWPHKTGTEGFFIAKMQKNTI